MIDLTKITTEQVNENSIDIDLKSTQEILQIINLEDQKIAQAVNNEILSITQAVELILKKVEQKGRVIYLGAGSSGRIGVLDASEMLPTYSSDDIFFGYIAGGDEALRRPIEGAEDSEQKAREILKEINLTQNDVVFVIGASGRTPFCIGALKYASEINAGKIALAMTKNSEFQKYSDVTIEVVPGPEVITGSTRMKAGTATKMVLNMISTTTMIKLNKVYSNLMVDVVASNKKLESRAVKIIAQITKASDNDIIDKLSQANGELKTAVVMILKNCNPQQAREILTTHHNNLREIIS